MLKLSSKSKNVIIFVIIVLTIIFIMSYVFDNRRLHENFMASLPMGYNYHLFTGDDKFFLFDNYRAIDNENPVIFNSYQEYVEYHKKRFPVEFEPLYPQPARRPIEGRDKLPILPYQWMCKRRFAEAVAKHRDCVDKIYTRYPEKECEEFLKENPRNDVFTNYNEEICMVNNFHKDYPDILNKDKIKKVSFSGFYESK